MKQACLLVPGAIRKCIVSKQELNKYFTLTVNVSMAMRALQYFYGATGEHRVSHFQQEAKTETWAQEPVSEGGPTPGFSGATAPPPSELKMTVSIY